MNLAIQITIDNLVFEFQADNLRWLYKRVQLGKCRSQRWSRRLQWTASQNKLSYSAIHQRAKALLPRPELCQYCQQRPARDLANKSQTYQLFEWDWLWLCRPCHIRLDRQWTSQQFMFEITLEFEAAVYKDPFHMLTTVPVNGELLMQARLRKNKKQTEVETELGIPPGRLTQYEKERANPSVDHVLLLANYYEVQPLQLISIEGRDLVLAALGKLASLVNAKVNYSFTKG